LANVAAVNANVVAANAAILLRANLTGANFTGNISANSISATNLIRTDTYFVGGTLQNQAQGETFANPAALFFGNSATSGNPYYQINLQNLHAQGSGDMVVTADDGNDLSNHIAFGINGSQYTDPAYPSARPHDGYVYITGGNLQLQSHDGNVELMSGNLTTSQIILTQSNILKLSTGVKIQFPDGTLQNTAFGGNANVVAINANITAANAAITALQSNAAAQSLDINSLYANAGSQATTLNSLSANAGVQAVALNNLSSNVATLISNAAVQDASIVALQSNIFQGGIVLDSLSANAATQALALDNLQSNAQAQQGSIITLSSNAATQAVQINLLNSNLVAANTNISTLTSNSAAQAVQINLVNANVTAANLNITTLLSNAASQALDINNLYTNVNIYLANVASSNANITAANARIVVLDANLGGVSSNVSTLQSNAATQETLINLLNANVAAANIAKANLSGAVFTSNVQANYLLANANVKIGRTVEVGNTNPINYPGLGAVFVGNVDSYYQVVVQNLSSNSGASGDFVITADNGNDNNGYLNIGINSSGWSGNYIVPAGDTGLKDHPRDGYLNVIGGNAAVRSDGNIFLVANTSVVVLNKDSNFLLFRTNLQFSDSSIQTTAVTDVPGLYANIGSLSVFQSNVLNNATYTPNNAANYNGTITNIQQALDQLAARLRALGG
jgi:hypothetical protein